jgi:hypothetical protein
MTPAAEAEIARLSAACTEPSSIEPSIRAAMIWMAKECLGIVRFEFENSYSGEASLSMIEDAIERRLK